jgi:hypothetical protein
MTVKAYPERGFDPAQFHTYGWDEADSRYTGDPRLDNNPFFFARVQADVEKALAAKGFEKTTSGTPELLIHIHASVTQRIDVSHADEDYVDCEDCEPSAYEAGTLVLDFVDKRTNRTVWRGSAEGSLEGVIDNQDWLEARIDEAVTRILERLPSAVAPRTAPMANRLPR